MSLDIDALRPWVGRLESATEVLREAPLRALSATLDRDDPPPSPGDALPAGAHWLYFLPWHRQSELGPDGHPRRGGFLPPVPLPRRMWAGGRLELRHPLRTGAAVTRSSRIVAVELKPGRSGPLVFVRVRHELADEAGVALVDEQDIVYRDAPGRGEAAASPAPSPEPGTARWTRSLEPDEAMLFRYSALTFNAHRIHYDQPYATQVEGYPGLVVHGPLVATLLLDLLRREWPAATLRHFDFRALGPLFARQPLQLCGRPDPATGTVALWACGPGGRLAMQARAQVQA